jgi:hypothetical protein
LPDSNVLRLAVSFELNGHVRTGDVVPDKSIILVVVETKESQYKQSDRKCLRDDVATSVRVPIIIA